MHDEESISSLSSTTNLVENLTVDFPRYGNKFRVVKGFWSYLYVLPKKKRFNSVLFFFLGGISFSGLNDNGDDIPGIGQYEDFHTIDWQRDIARDRMRHRYIIKKRQNSICDLIKVSFSFLTLNDS